jgi:cold-inducible RNA-binding protein
MGLPDLVIRVSSLPGLVSHAHRHPGVCAYYSPVPQRRPITGPCEPLRRFLCPSSSTGKAKGKIGSVIMTKLYVGNLSFNTTEDQLRELFSQFGQVTSAAVVMDRDTGRPRGFGFVEFGAADAAQAAINGLNGKNVDGRDLTVNEAKPRVGGGGGGGGGPRGGGGGGGRGGRPGGGGRGGW